VKRDITVVKLGGSFAFSPHLDGWLTAIEACVGHIVLVPGGGPFADAVRIAQGRMNFDDEVAHTMALLAMEQYGHALISLGFGLDGATTPKEIRAVLREEETPVWMPSVMVLESFDIPGSWDVTADSLAAWLAGAIGAKRVLLVKHIEVAGGSVNLDELVARKIVDPCFGHYLSQSGATAALAGAGDHEAVAAAICSGSFPGVPIDSSSCKTDRRNRRPGRAR
jgi:dihydroneopterin aldolase